MFFAGKFGHVDLLFCRNSLIAPYSFTMEKLLFVVRSLKERLVINLESLLLHGDENLREPIKALRGEEGGKSKVIRRHMPRKGNPVSVRLDRNRSSDPSRFSEGDRESHRMGPVRLFLIFAPYSKRKAWEDVADVRDGHDFF